MGKYLLIALVATLVITGCGLGKEKEAAENVAKELAAKNVEVADTVIFESKTEHPSIILSLNNPALKSPELDKDYLASKAALGFVTRLGMDKAMDYSIVLVRFTFKDEVFNKRFKVKTLNMVPGYYSKTKQFITAITETDTATAGGMLNTNVIKREDLWQVYFSSDVQKSGYGAVSEIKILGFEESYKEESQRNVIGVRALVYRGGKESEMYNFTFDRANQKIVGMAWDVLTPQAPPTLVE